jgi:hypothetical protein
MVGADACREGTVGAEALRQIACTLRSIDVCSAWMGGCLQ